MKNIRTGVYYITRDFDNDEIILKGDILNHSSYFGIQLKELLNKDSDTPELIIVIRDYKDEYLSKEESSYKEEFLLSLNDTGSIYISPLAHYSLNGPSVFKINIEDISFPKESVQFRIECVDTMKEIFIHSRENLEYHNGSIAR